MNFSFDLRYAVRLMIRSWGQSLTCAVVVALSVGLAVWTYALVYSQVLKPLPFAGSENWYSVQIVATPGVSARPSIDAYTWQVLLEHSSADYLGAISSRSVVVSEDRATTSLEGVAISPRLLAATGAQPIHGRLFTEEDASVDAAPVAILSHETWQRLFGGDPSVVGRTVRIDATSAQIAGIMPADFLMFDDYQVWLPLKSTVIARPTDSTAVIAPLIIARGEDAGTILRRMKPAIAKVNRDYPDIFDSRRDVALVPASRMFTHGVTPIVSTLGLMAIAVLLLGGVNISMVFLARLLERTRELALRTALGSSRNRLLRQCLLETGVIVAAGLAGGYGLAVAGVEWTHSIQQFGSRILGGGSRSPNLPEIRPQDLGMAVLFAVVIWLISTMVPALRVSRQDAAVVLGGTGKGANVRGGNRAVSVLVALQVIISCVVLVTCGNVVLGIRKEISKPRGVVTDGVLISTSPTTFDGRYEEPSKRVEYWRALEDSVIAAVPDAQVAFTTAPPTRPVREAATIESREGGEKQGDFTLPVTVVSERYFDLLNITLREGRLFDATDNAGSAAVAIVDENMAARYWPDGNVIGKRVRLNAQKHWLTIVGVVSAVRGSPYRKDAEIGSLYRPIAQAAPASFHMLAKVPPGDHRPAIRAAAYAIDRDLPLHNLQRFDDYMDAVLLSYPAMTRVFIAVALITAILAASGLFGLISRSVAQRTQEVGIRRALGATAMRSASMFMRQGAAYLAVSLVGLGLGVMLMPPLSRAFPNILEHLVPVSSSVVLLMAGVIGLASWIPTRKAVALEPGDALRYE